MPTYLMEFDLIRNTANRVFELEPKKEIVIERNRSYAQLHILKKYHNDKTDVKWKNIEPIIYLRAGGTVQ